VFIRKVSLVANEDTHVFDVTIVRNILGFDRVQHYVDFMNQGLVTVVISSRDNYMYDDVTKVSKFEVVVPRS
jgi:hypothetical protein